MRQERKRKRRRKMEGDSMIIINLWEWVLNFLLLGLGFLSYAIAFLIFGMLLSFAKDWIDVITNGKV